MMNDDSALLANQQEDTLPVIHRVRQTNSLLRKESIVGDPSVNGGTPLYGKLDKHCAFFVLTASGYLSTDGFTAHNGCGGGI